MNIYLKFEIDDDMSLKFRSIIFKLAYVHFSSIYHTCKALLCFWDIDWRTIILFIFEFTFSNILNWRFDTLWFFMNLEILIMIRIKHIHILFLINHFLILVLMNILVFIVMLLIFKLLRLLHKFFFKE
jgi:hypothetical protein